jgi:hypothetical protein
MDASQGAAGSGRRHHPLLGTGGGWEIAAGEDGHVTGRARFSKDRTRRYVLIRRWSHALDIPQHDPNGSAGVMPLTWVMLNPSTAGADNGDQTIRKCAGYAKRWGYGGIRLLNLFDRIATDPQDLLTDPLPCSPTNERTWEQWILPANGQEWTSLEVKPDVVVAWGDRGIINDRDQWAARMFIQAGIEPTCLGVTKAGQPLHPSRTAYDLERVPWKVL